jgi:hypothetical protein
MQYTTDDTVRPFAQIVVTHIFEQGCRGVNRVGGGSSPSKEAPGIKDPLDCSS